MDPAAERAAIDGSSSPRRRFVGLRWKGFLWMSVLLGALSTAFYWQSHYHLMRQHRAQRDAEVQSFHRQVAALFTGISDRLVRLGGTIVAMGNVAEAFEAASRSPGIPPAIQARFMSLGFELDVQRITLHASSGKTLWRWAPGLTAERLHLALAQVQAEERPVTLLSCNPQCLLHAFVPVLAEGRNIGVMEIGQSIADLVIQFRALTGTDIALLVPATGNGATPLRPWGYSVPAMSGAVRVSALLEALTSRFPDPGVLDGGQPLESGGASYEVHRVPLADFIPAERGSIVFISDVSAPLAEIGRTSRQVLLTTVAALAAGELLLLLLVGGLSIRLRRAAQALPLLAQGQHAAARERLIADRNTGTFRDEIDLLYDTAVTLSHQLEGAAKAIDARNRELAKERNLVQGILDAAQVLVVTQNRYGVIQRANEFAAQVTGLSTAGLRGLRFLDLVADRDTHPHVLSKIEDLCAGNKRRVEHEHDLVAHDGERRQILWVHTRLPAEHPDQAAVVSVGLDVTQRVEAESRMRWLANHDPLTGLCNRYRFMEDLTRSYGEVVRTRVTGALLLFDLDYFKEINDTSGHAAGDALLRMIAEELNSRARKSDVVARLGGDEFALLLPNTDAYGAEIFARQFNERLAETPFVYGDRHYRVGASIGIALLPDHGANVEELMGNADVAMYAAKRAGRGRASVFSYEQGEAAAQAVYWKDIFPRALAEGRWFFHYQPVSDAQTGAVAHHEALLRLTLPDGRVALPSEFLPAAQRAGLSAEIDGAVVNAALEVLRADPGRRLSINLSTGVWNDTRWVDRLAEAAREPGLDPGRLILEISDSTVVTDLAKAKRIMEDVDSHGFLFAVDDFPAGFSALHYLKHMPVAYVKLDLALVKGLVADAGDRDFVRAITMMVHAYGKKVVGKGVEDAATLSLLQGMGVDLAQGYYLGRPEAAPGERASAGATSVEDAAADVNRARGASRVSQ